jgi:hypothetical protein
VIARIGTALLVFALAISLSACAAEKPPQDSGKTPSVSQPPGGAAGTQLAPGLYKQADGTAQAIGTLDYRDLEGGTWVILGGSEATGDAGKTIAVIANVADLGSKLDELKGSQVVATGEMLDGVSIRMAGPEMKVMTIEKAAASADPAQ